MGGSHLLSRALNLFAGDAYFERYHVADDRAKSGLPMSPPLLHSFGAPLALDADLFVVAATGAELPNANTLTYTWATDGASPLDNVAAAAPALVRMADGVEYLVVACDVPRALTFHVTHGASIVAMTCIVSGFDEYGVLMTELFTITATGTDKSDVGAKAFKYITSFALTSAGNATTNTAEIGINDILGLPFRIDAKHQVIPIGDGALDAAATIVIADDTAATNATGDVRGTIDFNTASNAARLFAAWMIPASRNTKVLAFGITQA